MEHTAMDVSSAMESSLYSSLQAILRELDIHNPTVFSYKGMLRWTLHKKVESHQSNSVSLVRVLVKELEKVDRTDCKRHVIPLLHTLIYVAIQSGHIPDSLYQRVYDCFKRLLTLPEPYCIVALSYLKSIKMEQNTPGALYQKRVIAEQNLRPELFGLQERVFVFADPAVFSGALGVAVSADLELASPYRDTLAHERAVVLHTLQAGLRNDCHGPTLTQALENLGEDVVQFFQEVVLAVDHSQENGENGQSLYQSRLQHIYTEILTAANQDPKAHGCLSNAPLPTPEINFHLWTKEEDLWNALANFTLNISPSECSFVRQDDEDEEDMMKRASLTSRDSGIEKDLPDVEERELNKPLFMRKPGIRNTKPGDRFTLLTENIEGATSRRTSLSKEERNHTARLVVMGDDRVLGKLAKAYHSIWKREAKHLFLTKRMSLQIYYIPVTDEPAVTSPVSEIKHLPGNTSVSVGSKLSLASFLGRVDPWYQSNINSLGAMIPKLAEMHSIPSRSSGLFLVDVISYYLRCGLQPVHFPLYSVKISLSGQNPVEEVFVSHLQADFPELKQVKEKLQEGSIRRKKNTVETCGVVVSVNYRKVSLSKREVTKGMSLRTCGVSVSAVSPNETEGLHQQSLDRLTVHFDSTNPRNNMETRTQHITIRVLEDKTFTVCLDKDSRRTYQHVQSIEISPCLDPGCCLQTGARSKFSLGEEKGAGISKYLSKVLPLPINTFSGFNH